MNKKLLELYSDYLLSAFSHTTATGLSAMTGGSVSHDKITRFLANEELDSAALWLLVKPVVRRLDRQEEEPEEPAVLIIDDTIEEKPYTDESELVCWHYDHSKGRNVKGGKPHQHPLAGGRGFGAGSLRAGQENRVGLQQEEEEVAE